MATWMNTKNYKMIRLGALALTLVIFVGHYFLPQKRALLHPLESSVPQLYGFEDSLSGQSSKWVDPQTNEWYCNYLPSHGHGCGWDIYWDPHFVDGIDLRRFGELEFKLGYHGSATRLRIYMRNYNAEYAEPNNSQSTKFLSMTIPVDEINRPVRVRLNEFSVAAWWLRENSIRRRWALPEFDNITKVGVDFIEPGEHQLRVDEITLVGSWIGTETLLSIILGFWMGVFLLEGGVKFYQLYRQTQNRKTLVQVLEDREHHLRDEQETLRELADKDPLTRIYNRAGLRNKIAPFFESGRVKSLGIILLDIDYFKKINDGYGHDTGDTILIEFADLVSKNLRDSDHVSRWGGEEFLIVSQQGSLDRLLEKAEKLRDIVERYSFADDLNLNVTLSAGVSYIRPEDTFERLFKRADEALYSAKGAGRNRVEVEV